MEPTWLQALEVLISEHEIAKRVDEMAARITATIDCSEAVAVVALKGALILAADLVRRLPALRAIDFVQARSYGHGTESSGEVRILRDVEMLLTGLDVLLIDDILDTGLTSARLKSHLESQGARAVHLVTLLDKPSRRRVEVQPLITGFTVPDLFVVGYGMDFAERYRDLPYIAVLSPGEEHA